MKSDISFKKKRNTNKNLNNECLLDNIVDEEFQAVIFPLGVIPSIFLMSRFSIINNFITPDNNISFYIKIVLGSIIVLMTHIFRFIIITRVIGNYATSNVMLMLYFDLIFFCSVTIIMYIVNASHRINVVELIIKLQKVLNLIKVEKKTFLFKHRIHSWISILSLIISYVLYAMIASGDFSFVNFLLGFAFIGPMLIYDLQILSVTCAVIFIKNELVAWIKIMEAYNKFDTKTEVEFEDPENFQSNMFTAYVYITRAFELCNKAYQFSFTYYGFQTFIHSLLSVQFSLEVESSREANAVRIWIERFLSFAWNFRNFFLLATLSITCENFYWHIKIAESTCARILKNDLATGMRATCKNVLRLNRAAARKMSAFGVFDLDAAFPLRLLGGLVAYTVVLLQFAFL